MRTLLVLTLALAGCATDTKPDDTLDPAIDDGAFDSFSRPTDHGALALGTGIAGELTDDALFHTYTFELSDAARVALWTGATDGGPELDTMLYLYRFDATRGRWGSYLFKNDDVRGSTWSRLDRSLAKGSYRALVRGYGDEARGPFMLTSSCSGAGCSPAGECLFGGTYNELRSTVRLTDVGEPRKLYERDTLTELEGRQFIAAAKVSNEEVTTVADAFETVDQGELNIRIVEDPTTGARYAAFEYGAGDNSYGAVLEATSDRVVAEIHDGDLYECTVRVDPSRELTGRDCASNADCGTTHTCEGIVRSRGACAPTARSEHEGDACGDGAESWDCAPRTGLACFGLSRGGEGLCLPAWMRRSFEERENVAIGSRGIARTLTAYGLATVDMDVFVRGVLRAVRAGHLRIAIANPGGTEVVLFDGAWSGGDFYLDEAAPFSGDESVNGDWTLRVTPTGSGARLESWGLTIASRMD